jgi:hypothetical protein
MSILIHGVLLTLSLTLSNVRASNTLNFVQSVNEGNVPMRLKTYGPNYFSLADSNYQDYAHTQVSCPDDQRCGVILLDEISQFVQGEEIISMVSEYYGYCYGALLADGRVVTWGSSYWEYSGPYWLNAPKEVTSPLWVICHSFPYE